MESFDRESQDIRDSYRKDLRADPATGRSVRLYCAVSVLLNSLFIPIDYYTFTDQFWVFLALRSAVDAVLVYVLLRASYAWPIAGTQAAQLAIGVMIVIMIALDSKGISSQYASGLILIFCAFPIFAPLSAREIAVPIVPVYLAFLVVPQWFHPVDMKTYWLHAIFPSSGAIVGLASASVLDAIRFSGFVKRTQLEEARDHLKEMDATKARFTANIHHELRTPLTLMLVPVHAMLSGAFGEFPEQVTSYLQTMHTNGLRLLKLINSLLDLSKLESGQMEIKRREVDIAEFIENLVQSAGPMADRLRVSLRVECEPGLGHVYIDTGAMEKVLVNLIGNALKFTDSGGRISVRAMREEDRIHITVSDTGAGVPPDQLERIFDRFAQVDSSATRKHEGTGIGLSLARELVDLHGGRVWAESKGAGYGTHMHVLLPRGSCDAIPSEELTEDSENRAGGKFGATGFDPLAAEIDIESRSEYKGAEIISTVDRSTWQESDAIAGVGLPDSRAASIVIAEDNPHMRRLLSDLLGGSYRIRAVRNGREALESVHGELPDLVISDIMMPEMSGIDLCKAIKENPRTCAIPVILVTSKAERDAKILGLEQGADDYVTKPFHPRELLARVRTAVSLHLLRKEIEEKNASLQVALLQLREAQSQLVHREKMSALGQLVAGVAHEINNPVSFITGNLYYLEQYLSKAHNLIESYEEVAREIGLESRFRQHRERSKLDEIVAELPSMLEGIREGAERTLGIVGDLRTFSRLDRAEVDEANLIASLDSTLNLLRDRLREIELVRDYEDIPPVRCFGGQMNQVFMNLLTNAADATEGEGRITIRTRQISDDRVCIEIEDNGCGISPDQMQRIFDPFFTTKDIGKGTGLGLSVTYGIIERHRGKIEVKSEPGVGTCFHIELPIDNRDFS